MTIISSTANQKKWQQQHQAKQEEIAEWDQIWRDGENN